MSRSLIMSNHERSDNLDTLIRIIVRDELSRAQPAPTPPVEHLPVNVGAAIVGVAPGTLRRYIREGRLPAARVGRQLRVNRSDVEKLIRYARGARATPAGELSDAEIEALAAADLP